mgnify:FL=1
MNDRSGTYNHVTQCLVDHPIGTGSSETGNTILERQIVSIYFSFLEIAEHNIYKASFELRLSFSFLSM